MGRNEGERVETCSYPSSLTFTPSTSHQFCCFMPRIYTPYHPLLPFLDTLISCVVHGHSLLNGLCFHAWPPFSCPQCPFFNNGKSDRAHMRSPAPLCPLQHLSFAHSASATWAFLLHLFTPGPLQPLPLRFPPLGMLFPFARLAPSLHSAPASF